MMAYLGGLHFWWPKMTGRMYPEGWAKLAAVAHLHWLQPDLLPAVHPGLPGHAAPIPLLSAGVSGLAHHVVGRRHRAGPGLPDSDHLPDLVAEVWPHRRPEPVGCQGPGVDDPSPPAEFNFDETPIVTDEAYAYADDVEDGAQQDREDMFGTREAVEEEADNDRFLTAKPPSEGTR